MPIFYFSGKENYLKKQEIEKIAMNMECPELNFAVGNRIYKKFQVGIKQGGQIGKGTG